MYNRRPRSNWKGVSVLGPVVKQNRRPFDSTKFVIQFLVNFRFAVPFQIRISFLQRWHDALQKNNFPQVGNNEVHNADQQQIDLEIEIREDLELERERREIGRVNFFLKAQVEILV